MAPSSRSPLSGRGISNFSAILLIFWIFASTALAASGVIGIDFGTQYIKAALVKPGIPLEIVLTKDSRRKETSAVAFKPVKNIQSGVFPERVYGSDAIAIAARFPGDVYPNLKALLGLPTSNSKVIDYAARHPALKLESEKTRGTAAFRSSACAVDEEAWMVEEILAMELQSIRKNAEALAGKSSSISDVILTVPPFYGAEEKRAILLAADLAGLRVLSLISDGLAVGLNYATTRTFPIVTDGEKPEYHLVFDMGAGSTKATVMRFQGRIVKDGRKPGNKTIQEVQVMGAGWDRTLGGDALNSLIVDDMIESFISSKAAKAASITAESVQTHGRAAAKLWKEAERLRTVLSANAESQSSFEGLYEEVDFRYKLNRAGFETLTEAYAERVAPVVESALLAANLKIADLDSIILHGGAVRTPFIQRQLEKIVGSTDKLRSNVNADEAAVFGAAFKGASLSPWFRVKEIRTSEAAGYRVGMKWQNVNDKHQHQQLYGPSSVLGVEKMISFPNQKDFSLLFYQHIGSAENVSPGSEEKELVTLTTKNLTATFAMMKDKHGCTDGDILAKFGVRINPEDGEVEITKAALHCELEEDEKKGGVVDGVKGLFGFGAKKSDQDVFKDADIVSDMTTSSEPASTLTESPSEKETSSFASASTSSASSAAKDEKAKPVKRLIAIPLDFEVERKGYPQLPATELIRMKDRLTAFDDSDRSRLLREESLNLLEAFTYKVRDLIDDASFIKVSTEAERNALEEKSKAASEWLYGNGADARREDLREKLKEMKDIVIPIEKRKEEAEKRPEQIKLLQEALNQTKSFIDVVRSQIEREAVLAESVPSETTSTTTPAAEEPTTVVDDEFAGLEDEEAATSSSATSAEAPRPTPPSPKYDIEGLNEVVALYESTKEWFEAKLAEQEKLDITSDPVLSAKELALKANQLTKASVEMLTKAMKPPAIPKRPSSKTTKTKKAKTVKSKKPKDTAVPTGDNEKVTVEILDDEPPSSSGGSGRFEAPTEEEILEALMAERNGERKAEKKKKGPRVVDEL